MLANSPPWPRRGVRQHPRRQVCTRDLPVARVTVRQIFLASYTAGVVFFAGTFYWITETMIIYGGLSAPLAVGVGALFTLTYALYFVLFGLGLHLAMKKFGARGLFFASPLWVTVELLRAILFSGFPWTLLGYALVPYTGTLQMAAWTGRSEER